MSRRNSGAVFGILIAVVVVMAASPALASGNCITARVDESVVLPDGTVHEPGTVTICPETMLSPAVRLCSIAVNGRTAGVWMNRVSEGGRFVADGGTVSLRRLSGGRLALTDYYWPDAKGRAVTAVLALPATETAVEAGDLFAGAFRLQ